jgi:hypothetical protein
LQTTQQPDGSNNDPTGKDHTMLPFIRHFFYRDTTWLEIINASFLFVWAIVLSAPLSTFDTSMTYDVMAAWASEPIWATLSTTLGACGFWGLRLTAPLPRRIALLGGIFLWGTIGVSMVFSNIVSTGGWIYLVFAHFCALAYISRWR